MVWSLYLVIGVVTVTSAIGGILNGVGSMVSGVTGGSGSEDITVQVQEAMQSGKEEAQATSDNIKQQMFDLIGTGEKYNVLPEDAEEETSELIQDSKAELKQLNLENDIEEYVNDVSFDLDQDGNLKITGEGSDEFFDKEKIKQSLTENTELSDEEINGVIEKWETRIQTTVDKAEKLYAEAKAKVEEYSDKAADAAGTAGIVAFLILLLGGGAAFFGGITGSPEYALLVDEDRTTRGKTTRASKK